ncbi:hypothetical protein KCH_29850 [Kitasatospora cheerisanensis KCTC 2395]|uniref:Uncharacterized protein n=1 Tax=Kitasatospora cheerisanensis KCTC 2395 TaxID=1348663 RepID=A0A066YZI5_9ACTN|nr:hypothetical protein KCH_29850 [Kitasatospora cheerisanensis KCTC 2395]
MPGTSRAAPAPGEQLQPPRFVARYLGPPPYSIPPGLAHTAPTGPLIETGPIYLDETGAHTAFNMPVHPDVAEPPPVAVDVRPRSGSSGSAGSTGGTGMSPLRPGESAPWAVAGNGLQPVTAESWATAAALRLGPVPEPVTVAPQRGGGGVGESDVPAVEFEPVVEPEAVVVEEVGPRPAQPLGGTPWHGGAAGAAGVGAGAGVGGGMGGDGSVGMSATPGPLYEPRGPFVPRVERAEREATRGPRGGGPKVTEAAEESRAAEPAAGSAWRADPRAQRGLMDTGNGARRVSWGVVESASVESEPAEPVAAGPVPAGPVAARAASGKVSADEASSPEEQVVREPRAAHVTSERVRPPRGEAKPTAAGSAAERARRGCAVAGSRGGPLRRPFRRGSPRARSDGWWTRR